MAKLTKPITGCSNGAVYPREYAAGEECPADLEDAARASGALADDEDAARASGAQVEDKAVKKAPETK